MRVHIAAHFKKRFVSGILVGLPLFITAVVLRVMMRMVTGLMTPVLEQIFPHISIWVKMLISLAILMVLIYFLGVAAGHFLGHWFLARLEQLLMQIPLLRSIYGSSREVVRIFLNSEQKTAFKEVVLVEFPGPGLFSFGFVTGSIINPHGKVCYKVFIPTTPNPTTGFLEVIEQSRVIHTGMSVEEGIKTIMSGGLLGPDDLRRNIAAASLGVEQAAVSDQPELMKGIQG